MFRYLAVPFLGYRANQTKHCTVLSISFPRLEIQHHATCARFWVCLCRSIILFNLTTGVNRKSAYPGKGLSGSLSGAAPLPPINQTSSGYETSGTLTTERLRKRAKTFSQFFQFLDCHFPHLSGFCAIFSAP